MTYFVLLLIVISFFGANIFQNRLSGSLEGRIYPSNLFQVVWMFLAAAVFLVLGAAGNGGLHFSSYTVSMGMLAGVFVLAGGMCLLGAMAVGPLSLTILIFSMYVIVPAILSILFLKEEVTVFQIVGMVLILIVLVISNPVGGKEEMRGSRVWWLLCIGSVLGTGLSNYVMKVHQYHLPGQQIFEYSISSYIAGIVCAGILAGFFYNREKKQAGFVPYRFTWKCFFGPAAGMAVTEGIANVGNLYNASRMPAIVLYPVSQLGTLMLTVVFGVLVLKEKLTGRSVVCLVLGIAAILCMNF